MVHVLIYVRHTMNECVCFNTKILKVNNMKNVKNKTTATTTTTSITQLMFGQVLLPKEFIRLPAYIIYTARHDLHKADTHLNRHSDALVDHTISAFFLFLLLRGYYRPKNVSRDASEQEVDEESTCPEQSNRCVSFDVAVAAVS